MKNYSSLIFSIAWVSVIVALGSPLTTRAASVLYNTTVPDILFYANSDDPGPNQCYGAVQNPNVTIQYRANATDAATGASVCGATLPAGTRIRFTFDSHTPQDVYWFGTGFDHDSPYGDWSTDAAPPAQSDFCNSHNYINTFGWESQGAGRRMANQTMIPLRIAPPQQVVTGLDGFTCDSPAADGSVTCVAATAGTYTPSFTFAQTYGYFYFGILWDPYWGSVCSANTKPLRTAKPATRSLYYGIPAATCSAAEAYSLPVPAQKITCPITVKNVQGVPPNPPTLTTVSAACSTGVPYTVSLQATDPDGDTVQYNIDWNNDGISDQVTAFVPSGTPVSVARTFVLSTTKTLRVRTVDSTGLSSGWVTTRVTCNADTAATLLFGDESAEEAGSRFATSGATSGATVADLTLRVLPSLVKPNATSTVTWSATHVSSCTVTGSNDDGADGSWAGTQSPIGGKVTAPITTTTAYTLSCISGSETLKRTAYVRVVPSWKEQ